MTDINLLAKKTKEKKSNQKTLIIHILSPIVLGLFVMIGIHFYYTPQLSAQRANNSSLEGQIKQLDGQIINAKELEADQNEVKAAINAIFKIKYQRYIALKVIKLITSLTPKNIYLLNVINNGGNITLIGQTLSKKSVTDFLNQLGKIDFISAPKLDEIVTDKDTNLNSFKITFMIKQPAEFYDIPKDVKK